MSALYLVVVWLTAVLCAPLTAVNNKPFSSRRPREQPFRGHISRWTEEPLEEPTNKEMTVRDMHKILHIEGGEEGSPVDCCPTIKEMSEPVGGQNQQNMYVELYRDGNNRQRFFELSCRPDVLDKPCRFIDRKFRNQSRCVQKYAYSYAIVENHENLKIGMEEHKRHHRKERNPALPSYSVSGSGWTLDYIMVRSGCSCQIMPKPKKKKIAAAKARRAKSKHRQSRNLEVET
ncbi:hypothetical protein ACFW04_005619 [Cataglyphis niger]